MTAKLTKDYIVNQIKRNIRGDDRKLDEMREVIIERGVSANAEGSARVKLGKTEVIAGIKMDLAEPYPDSQDRGVLTSSAEFLPLAAPEFEAGRPGEVEVELGRVVDRGIREAEVIDFKKLCIVEGEKVWRVFMDIVVINHDGNLMDASGLAAMTAILDAKMPTIDKDYKIDYNKREKPLPLTTIALPITVMKCGNKLIIDTTADEEEAIDTRLTVTTNESGNISSMQKGGPGGFTVEEVVEICKIAGKKTDELIKKHFKSKKK
ncbi:MAG: exosome complex protein Rrp42 [Candidatus Aenigmarchaeota archaeon]|nr:exosome complex protein Rrp42 [Candidatus Aenigmarchaeota archaeon]